MGLVNVCKVGVLLDTVLCLLFVSRGNGRSLSDFYRVSLVTETLLCMFDLLGE